MVAEWQNGGRMTEWQNNRETISFSRDTIHTKKEFNSN